MMKSWWQFDALNTLLFAAKTFKYDQKWKVNVDKNAQYF